MSPCRSVADAVICHKAWLCEQQPILERLYQAFATSGESGLLRGDMLTLAATVRDFQPDVVLELGRGRGTSTALFRHLGVPVVSVCRSRNWQEQTLNLLSKTLPNDWSKGVDAIVGEIADQDYPSIFKGSKRILIFWDAHGYNVAEAVLNGILPGIRDRNLLVACHDMRDSRYMGHNRPSKDAPIWRGQQAPYDRFLRLGNVHSAFEQLVSIVDFVSWNGIEFRSPMHEIMTTPEALTTFVPVYGVGWPYCLWHYFLPAGHWLMPE